MNTVPKIPVPVNEPVLSHAPGTPERAELKRALKDLSAGPIETPLVIGGKEVRTGKTTDAVMPHCHRHVLAKVHQAGPTEVRAAIAAAREAWREWSAWSLERRAAVFLKAAELLATRHRAIVNAATMLGQSKTAHQAEIDAACELIDFWRFNLHYAEQLYAAQPISSAGTWNQLEYRPLEGFVYAITPFNFTSIGGELPPAPAVIGCPAVWEPAAPAASSQHHPLQLLGEGGGPPRAREFGCSAASRAYVPDTLWPRVKERVLDMLGGVRVGDPADFRSFMGAVIDRKAFEKIRGYVDEAKQARGVSVLFGGGCDDSDGWFVQPTLLQVDDPGYRTMCEEIFGPVLTVYAYPEKQWRERAARRWPQRALR